MAGEDTLPNTLFERLDVAPDAAFYHSPRFVQHIDESTIAALSAYYAEILSAGADVLDLMSSWVSHLPEQPVLGRVAGLGMNSDELAANPRLSEYCVHDLNAEPRLPYDDAEFDVVLIAVSVQYLARPIEVFADIARVLRPGGRVVVGMSHRCFPTKAIRAFHGIGGEQRISLVREYVRPSGLFGEATGFDRSPESGDPLWVETAERHT